MDPMTVTLVLEGFDIAKRGVEELASAVKLLKEFRSKLNELLKKTDQLVLREIQGAFAALVDGLETGNKETKRIRLEFAESHLLRNTQLDPSLETGERPNRYWMALANYGLAVLSASRRDDEQAAKHLVRTFEIAPREARTEIAPQAFARLFEERCADLYAWKVAAEANIEADDYEGVVLRRKLGAGCMILAGAAATVFTRSAGVAAATGRAVIAWQQAGDVSDVRAEALAKVEEEVEEKLDERCREVAREMAEGTAGGRGKRRARVNGKPGAIARAGRSPR